MQFEWNSKDSISFELYKEVVENKTAQFLIWLESDNREINLVDLRNGNTEYRFSNFIIKENKDNNTITFCPNIAGCPAYFRIKTNDPCHMSIKRKDGTQGDELDFKPGEIKLELNPTGLRVYKVSVETEALSQELKETKTETKNENDNEQIEDVPEFFGGSFSSSSKQSSAMPPEESAEVINNPINDTGIFTGEFNSENKTDTTNEINDAQQPNSVQESPASTPGSTIPLFAGMFPTASSKQIPSNNNELENHTSSESINIKPQETKTDSESFPFDTYQSPSSVIEPPSEENVSVFSVPYVETDGIRQRRDTIQKLQQDNDKTAQEVEKLDRQIAELKSRLRQLSDSKSSLISQLEVLQQEFDNNYSKYQDDIDEIKDRYTVDKSILDYYKDKDLVTIEDLFKQTDNLLNRMEDQIRLFVTAQQNKSDEIEKALKVGKKE